MEWDFECKLKLFFGLRLRTRTWRRNSTDEWVFTWYMQTDDGNYHCNWSDINRTKARYFGIIEMIKDIVTLTLLGDDLSNKISSLYFKYIIKKIYRIE